MTGRGNFFAVDRSTWASVCDLGSINAAVAYLVLARGTLADMRTTSWSVNAIERYTAIARPRAASAIEILIGAGLVVRTRGGKHPAYTLTRSEDESAWIWLPNSIVDGAARETPPVERLRQTQSLPTLRLFVDLYAAQDLAADGGVNWRMLRKGYARERIGQRGPYIVWGFRAKALETWGGTPVTVPFLTGKMETREGSDGAPRLSDTGMPAFWKALGAITDLGLLDFIDHLIEADTGEASVIHPMGAGEGAEDDERALVHAAEAAAWAMMTSAQQQQPREPFNTFVPVLKHLEKVALVGLPRLRHRARTAATAEWRGRAEKWREWTEIYRRVEQESLSGQPHAISMGINISQR